MLGIWLISSVVGFTVHYENVNRNPSVIRSMPYLPSIHVRTSSQSAQSWMNYRTSASAIFLSPSPSSPTPSDSDNDDTIPQPPEVKVGTALPSNDTMAINSVGKAISSHTTSSNLPPQYDLESASRAVLAIDPSTIEIVPLSLSSDSPPSSSLEGETPLDFVDMFRGSANYIANHRNTVVVYHIPGELIDDDFFPELMDDIALTWLLGMKPVIVAGCRKQIDEKMRKRSEQRRRRLQGDSDNEKGDQMQAKDGDNEAGRRRHYGLRVTDYEDLRVVKEEAGYVRFELERQLGRALRMHRQPSKQPKSSYSSTQQQQQHQQQQLSSTTRRSSSPPDNDRPIMQTTQGDGNIISGNFYSAQPYGVIDGIDFMYTGFPRRIETEKIRQAAFGSNDVVLLTNLGASPSGEVYNVDSENLASRVAGAMGASKLIYFTGGGRDVVFRQKIGFKPVQNLRVSDAKALLHYNGVRIDPKRGFATMVAGSSPSPKYREPDSAVTEALFKVGYSLAALEAGVRRAHIIAPENGALLQELYTRDGSGTLISRDLYDGIRQGNIHDVAGIFDLIEPLVKAGTLVPRPRTVLESDVESYFVYTRDELIVACAQLKLFDAWKKEEEEDNAAADGGGGYAEIGCMVVSREYRSQGRGDAMLGCLERLSLLNGCRTVFVLSTQTMEWFVERGFKEVGVESLPPLRREVYNYERRSKIYMKKIMSERDLDTAELWWNR